MSIVRFPQGAYAVTEAKQKELDALKLEVLAAQGKVQQFESMVASLNAKSQTFATIFSEATANKAQALSNWELMEKVANDSKELVQHSDVAFNDSAETNVQINELAVQMKMVVDQLIFAAEFINKLNPLLVNKQESLTTLDPAFIEASAKATTDANKAVALTITALESCYSALNSSEETEALLSTESLQSSKLYQTMTNETTEMLGDGKTINSIYELLKQASLDANASYETAKDNNVDVTKEVQEAQVKLDSATIKLQSLEAGYAAAKAAALA